MRRIFNLSFFSLLLANAVIIYLAVTEGWEPAQVMWIYWCQSVIIGGFNVARMLPYKATEGAREISWLVLFFVLHYGFFHLGYAVFLLAFSMDRTVSFQAIGLSALLFFFNHLISFLTNRPRKKTPFNLARLLFFPYARIIPMHFTILFGGISGDLSGPAQTSTLVFFMCLKTVADVIMHVIEHFEIGSKEG